MQAFYSDQENLALHGGKNDAVAAAQRRYVWLKLVLRGRMSWICLFLIPLDRFRASPPFDRLPRALS